MKPLDVRRGMFKAANDGDKDLALAMCNEVLIGDLFIGAPAEPTGHEKFIPESEYHGRCGKCGEHIPPGGPIYWGKGVGQWHAQCYKSMVEGAGSKTAQSSDPPVMPVTHSQAG